jgi:hypothetical protein
MPVGAKSFLCCVMIWFLSLSGTVQGQQEKGQEDKAGTGQSPSDYHSYMGGKEHYLPDSPYYMAGKEHYLQGQPSSNSGKPGQGKEQIPKLSGDQATKQRKESEEQGGNQFQIEINIIPREPTYGYGIIALPEIRPKHKWGGVSPPPNVKPNPPPAGKFTPNVPGGFHQGTINFR